MKWFCPKQQKPTEHKAKNGKLTCLECGETYKQYKDSARNNQRRAAREWGLHQKKCCWCGKAVMVMPNGLHRACSISLANKEKTP